ncbi:MAG: response regulator transcription factor [Ruminococcus sp.]|nr:response regulator transcription factor [Ruminococcus sp.]HBB18820.1 DNA-binding response regulator [Ruminococcus sp.]HOO06883.1 response regulator transcription factor [Ruminococcus sp.]
MSDILLVEDDAQLARNLIRFLRAEGFSVTHRISQTAALEAFAAQKFDCALVDISLAEGNGFSVCAAIKRESDTPVIFLTASADEDCTVAGFEIGADDYISKPFRPRELIARMKNVMRRSKPADTMISCGDVVVDTSRGTVTKDGSEVFLSPMEYRLLLVFFTNKEKVLSRDRLADELWSYSGEFISDNTLNVYIKRLREKIEDDPQDPKIIRTVRGLGYKAVER